MTTTFADPTEPHEAVPMDDEEPVHCLCRRCLTRVWRTTSSGWIHEDSSLNPTSD